MQRYYFAESCLNVYDESGFIQKALPSCFLNPVSYSNDIVLTVINDNCPVFDHIINVSTGSGISVDDINGEKWLFSSSDKNNHCVIEAIRDCSSLLCYINPSNCADEKVLIENFKLLLQTAVGCHLAHYNGVTLHSSFISYQDQGILFTAPSGTGKSTQADIWNKSFGAQIINGDRPFLQLFPDGVRAYGVPWDGKEQTFIQENYPVLAIIEIRQSKFNSIRKLSENQAFKLMMKQCYIPMWDDTARFFIFNIIRIISKTVPFYRLFCLPFESTVKLLHEFLFLNNTSLLKKEQHDMKLKDGFVLRNVIDEWIVVPTGNNIKIFKGAIVLNEVAVFIWNQLNKPISYDDLLLAVLDEYDVDENTASADINLFIDKLNNMDILV